MGLFLPRPLPLRAGVHSRRGPAAPTGSAALTRQHQVISYFWSQQSLSLCEAAETSGGSWSDDAFAAPFMCSLVDSVGSFSLAMCALHVEMLKHT